MMSKRLLCSAVILLFASFPGAASGAMSWVSSAHWPFSYGQDDGVMPVPSLVWPKFELRGFAVVMLVAPSLPAPAARGDVLWALWRAETDLPYSVIDGFAAMFDATLSCGLCSGFAHPGRSPPCFQFPLLAATLDSAFKNVGFIVLAPVSVVFSVDVHCPAAGKAMEGKCQKLKPSFEDYDLREVRFADSAPKFWLLGRQLGSSIVNFISAVAQVAAWFWKKLRHDILSTGLKENAVIRALYIYQKMENPNPCSRPTSMTCCGPRNLDTRIEYNNFWTVIR